MRINRALIALFLISTSLAGVATASDATKPAVATSAAAQPVGPDYVIGAQDVLGITVWKEPDLSSSVPVRPDGKISLPLLNDVQAAGMTPMQLAEALSEKLKKFVSAPQVSVIVTAVNSQRIYILGEVARPGAMPLLGEMSVLQAISNAGGLSQFANSKKIYVLRTVAGVQQRFPFNYKQAIKGSAGAQDIALKPGDTIVVP